MPDIISGESKEEFIDRCIPMVIDDGTAENGAQAVAICNAMWDQAHDTNKKAATVKALDVGQDAATVGGYGVIFGGLDIEHEGFKKNTDFMLDLVPTKMITYNHTLSPDPRIQAVKHFIGHSTNESIDEIGIWVEAQLDLSKKYVKNILKLVEKGLLGWSSATAAHLATKSGNYYERWPIVEYALTPIPAEPRALGVRRLKALAEIDPGLQKLFAEDFNGEIGQSLMAGAREKLQLKAQAFLLVNED